MVKLDLSHLPPIHVLPARFSEEELHTLEAQLQECGANLTYSHHEADLYLADLNTPRRCELELRKRGLWTKQFETGNPVAQSDDGNRAAEKGKEKRKERQDDARIIKVVKLKWFTQSFAEEVMADMARFIVYTGRVVPAPENGGTDGASAPTTPVKNNAQTIYSVFQHTLPVSRRSPTSATQPTKKPRLDTSSPTHSSPSPARIDARKHVEGILERAQRDAQEHRGKDGAGGGGWRFRGGHYQSRRRHDSRARADEITRINHQPSPKLEHLTTKEWEDDQLVQHTREMPEYVKKGLKYACQRPHPLTCPNDHFISFLRTIKLSRTLSLDAIGIRAYSTAIAAIQAYPYPLLSSSETSKLPGCDGKASSLFHEYIQSSSDPTKRTLQVVKELEANEEFKTLSLFWGIWGVGAKTAGEFYFEHGWRTLDDVVDFGWDRLSRVQQIGLKYYSEFNDIKIPREEVTRIGSIIGETANKLRPGYEYIITGGYRRGKPMSGDVDLVLSNRDERATQGGFVGLLVEALEKRGWVTHTLYLGRGGGFGSQRLDGSGSLATHIGGAGFDNLEKAMVVWQEQDLPCPPDTPNPHNWHPYTPTTTSNPKHNPHPHRRVDIILSPPDTVGTAILGWTGGTTYERDLRRYVKATMGWKFDSGGVWDRRNGERVEGLGRWEEGEDLVKCERRVVEGLGLRYYVPELRNTG